MAKKKKVEEATEVVTINLTKLLMNKDNIFLVQFHPDASVNEVYEENGMKKMATGQKIFSVHDGYSKQLAYYDQPNDNIDLSCLVDKEDCWIVAVSATVYNSFKWICMLIGKPYELNDHQVFSIKGQRDCLPEEVEFLNETFPGYLNASF